MDRRELLKRAVSLVPAASVASLLAVNESEAARRRPVRGIEGLIQDLQTGRLNGATIIMRITRPDTLSFADFVLTRKTVIVAMGQRVRFNWLLEMMYAYPEEINRQYFLAPVKVLPGPNGVNPKRVDIYAP
jgi:hypothetical protein